MKPIGEGRGMVGLVKLVGIMMLVAGVIYFLKPNLLKKVAKYFFQEKRLKIGGAIALIIGIVLLRAAGQCSISWVVVIFGIIAIIKGILAFALDKKKFDSLLNWMVSMPPKTIRKIGLLDVALGVILIYAI